nr:hypothetical protein [uncultured organism]
MNGTHFFAGCLLLLEVGSTFPFFLYCILIPFHLRFTTSRLISMNKSVTMIIVSLLLACELQMMSL